MVPPKPKFVTYYRVSTQKQGRSGLGIEAQKSAVESYLYLHPGTVLASYTEVESGKTNERPQLQAALLRCRQSRATLLVAKLDRLSRNAAFLLNLRDSGVMFQALDIPEANTLSLGILATLAQHERELISARTKAALAARRARGLPLGTPRDLSAHAARASRLGCAANSAKARARAAEVAPVLKTAREIGCKSLRAIAEYLNGLEISTPRGKRWTAAAVSNAQRFIADT
jgi:DNA invertase Pin-like site-specific DNA recombinase